MSLLLALVLLALRGLAALTMLLGLAALTTAAEHVAFVACLAIFAGLGAWCWAGHLLIDAHVRSRG